MTRLPVPRAVVERLRELDRQRERIEAEASGYVAGVTDALGIDPASITGVDDGDQPALLIQKRKRPAE